MQINRRTAVIGGLAAGALWSPDAVAQPDDDVVVEGMERFEPLPTGFRDGVARAPADVNFGTVPPPAIYAALGSALLRGAPFNCRPIDIAYYFSNLREGRLPEEVQITVAAIATQAGQPQLGRPEFLKYFAYDWEENRYFNPVVIGFFNGNRLRPYAGDATPWCAAFANWCIARSRVRQPGTIVFDRQTSELGTSSASSGSFRCWGTDSSSDPREGDLIVWAQTGTITSRCPTQGPGHVAFLTAIETFPDGSRRYKVVGGNQGYRGNPVSSRAGSVVRPQDVAQAVSRRTIGRRFADRVFHSTRTASYLR